MAAPQVPSGVKPDPPPDPDRPIDGIYRREFARLRRIAQRLLSKERVGHSLQPTALVHESFLKLHSMRGQIESKEHFFHLSARAMKQALIDHARMRGKWIRVGPESLPELLCAGERSELDLDLALDLKKTFDRLGVLDEAAARALWLRHVEGRTIEDTADLLGRRPSRVREDCDFALKWMADQLNGPDRAQR